MDLQKIKEYGLYNFFRLVVQQQGKAIRQGAIPDIVRDAATCIVVGECHSTLNNEGHVASGPCRSKASAIKSFNAEYDIQSEVKQPVFVLDYIFLTPRVGRRAKAAWQPKTTR